MMNLVNRQELFKSLLNILKAPQKFQLLKYNQAQALTMRTRSQKRNSNLQKSPNIIRNLSKQEHQIDNNMLRDTSSRYHNSFSSLRNYWRHSLTSLFIRLVLIHVLRLYLLLFSFFASFHLLAALSLNVLLSLDYSSLASPQMPVPL